MRSSFNHFDDVFSQSDLDFAIDTQSGWDVESISRFCDDEGVLPVSRSALIECAAAHEALAGG